MESILIVVTCVALSLAVGMALLAWKLLRDDRRRSARRVETLEALAALDASPETAAVESHRAGAVGSYLMTRAESYRDVDAEFDHEADATFDREAGATFDREAGAELDHETMIEPEREIRPSVDHLVVTRPRRHVAAAPRSEPGFAHIARATPRQTAMDRRPSPVAARFSALDDDGEAGERWLPDPMPASGAMFRATSERGGRGRRWLVMACIPLLMAAGAGGAWGLLTSKHSFASLRASLTPASNPEARPIELLSLHHAAGSDGSFAVTGLVQNPADGQRLHHVSAVVYLFDQDGNYFATGRAALDYADLQPGDESPFVIRLPNAGRVGRYRVGFRTDDGVVAHVDKRGAPLGGTTGNAVTVAHSSGDEQ